MPTRKIQTPEPSKPKYVPKRAQKRMQKPSVPSQAAAPTTEKQKMLTGVTYDGGDAELVADRQRAQRLCQQFNALPPGSHAQAAQVLQALFGRPVQAELTPPFRCDYGYNIELGEYVYFNFDCVILDVARVRIGPRTLFGPGVHIYCATHPLERAPRRAGEQGGKPVTIGEDCWIGGRSVILPGVTIGDGSVIGAGSVVTRDIPPGVLAVGNPCRVVREI